jgi:hypothetical protein
METGMEKKAWNIKETYKRTKREIKEYHRKYPSEILL